MPRTSSVDFVFRSAGLSWAEEQPYFGRERREAAFLRELPNVLFLRVRAYGKLHVVPWIRQWPFVSTGPGGDGQQVPGITDVASESAGKGQGLFPFSIVTKRFITFFLSSRTGNLFNWHAVQQGTTNVRELIAYRREAEQYLGQDDHLYRIDWAQDGPTPCLRTDVEDRGQGANVMRIWLLGASDASIDLCGARTASGSDATSKTRARSLQMASRWRTYAESYVLSHPTELVDAARVRKPFLHRTKLEEEGDDANGDGDVPKGRRRWVSDGLVEESGQSGEDSELPLRITVKTDCRGYCGWAIPAAQNANNSEDESKRDGRMAKRFSSHLLSLHHPPRGHSSARHRPARADPHAVRRSTKKYTGARAPSLAVLAALATLAGAAPLDNVATTTPAPGPISADVPDFLCPALASSPATTGAGFSATPAAQPFRCAVETTTAPPPAPQQQQQQQRLAYKTFYLSACNGEPVATHTVVDVDFDAYTVAHAPDTRRNKDAANNYRRRRTRSSRSLPDSFIKSPQDESNLYSDFTPTLSFSPPSSNAQIARGDATTYSSSSTPSASPTECSELYTSRTIPDRYELGNDGRWHKLSVWSSCSLCQCDTQTSHDVDDSADNEISATGVTNDAVGDDEQDLSNVSATASSTPTGSSNPSPVVLPVGWDRRSDSAVYRVPLIVIASLLVAIAVCSAVWFTFFWRRRQRLAKQLAQARDLEKKRRKAEGIESGSEEDMDDDSDDGNGRRSSRNRGDAAVYADGERREKKDEGKAKARWARATAQWKAHARWIARRRRGRTGIVDGMRQRDDAMASGVSLARSTASSRASSRNEAAAAMRISRDGGEAGRQAELELPPGPEEEEIAGRDPMPGIRVRAGDGPMTGNRSGGALRDPEISSEASRMGMGRGSSGQDQLHFRNENQALGHNEDHRDLGGRGEVEAEGEAAVINANQSPSGASRSQLLPRPRSRIGEVNTVPLPLSRYPSRHPLETSEPPWDRDYDHPPLEGDIDDEEQREAMSPPAYRVRGIAHVSGVPRTDRRRTRTRLRRDQKSASGLGYVPNSEDCAPYSSSEDECDDASGSTISTRDDGTSPVDTNMHIAVDDKHALARLAEYASAPPPLSPASPPTTTATSPSSSSYVHSQQLPEANAPPETDWFEGYAAAVCDDDMTADSPGAGPGPSTVFARAASPSSSRSGSPSCSQLSGSHAVSRSGARSLFPAPPQPVTSCLAYAPADAGLRLDHSGFGFNATVTADSKDSRLLSEDAHMQRYHDFSRGFDFELGLGLDPDEEVDDVIGGMFGPSAPPFEDALADASAPPMFFDEEGGAMEEQEYTLSRDNPRRDVQVESTCVHQIGAEPSPPPPPPDIVHSETSDRDAVLSAVR
ncbi:uncharacterized protein FOMMEDRAFT_161493 [Fomitiporia mediterranea MF3/22]|uniref:uncharacterized protein n=1 Tax=Fomitiporia mediterranea (strain MF3/22) TaxID=694068 RepID=UPI0004408648|nr:uncharacterized protein FOMMEDRAFT_161493 [Fomitiporia mediterranea MF3/22]EJC98662.1 hypothetical protein FOMMEDRAFT_161493 [Fomitiporia mediterranea MF3/22]